MRPINLKLENFLSHSKSEIDFDKFNVALVLGSYDGSTDQSNGSGKSALFSSVEWVIFGKARHKKKDGVVKKDKKECRVQFTFEVDGAEYRITRRRDKVVGEGDVVFEQFEAGNWKNISCDTNTLTDEKIMQVVCVNHEVFVNSVYFKQNDISTFAQATPSKRKDILKSLLKLDEWDEYHDQAKNKAKTLNTKLEEKNKNKLDISDLTKQIEKLGLEIEIQTKQLSDFNGKYSVQNKNLIDTVSKKNAVSDTLKATPEQIKRVEKERQETKKRTGQINGKLEENETIIMAAEKALTDVQEKMPDVNARIRNKQGIDLQKRNAQLVQGQTKRNGLKEKIEHLTADIVSGEACPTCDKKLTAADLRELEQKREQDLLEHETKFTETQAKLSKLQTQIRTETVLFEDGNRAEIEKSKLEIKRSKADTALNNAQSENKLLSAEVRKLQIRNFEAELGVLKSNFNEEELNNLETQITNLNTDLLLLRANCDQLNMDLGSKTKTKSELERVLVEQKVLKTEISQLSDDFTVFDKLRQYFSKDGIQAVIIENVIEEIETYTNDTLQKICNDPISITIKTQRQNENGSWAETLDLEISIAGRTDEFEALSGGEQFRVSLAVRLALSKILSKRMGGALKFLLLDEVSSSLDDKGLKMFIDAIKQLGQEMKILVITHDEKLKEQFDDLIVVNKTNEGSKAFN